MRLILSKFLFFNFDNDVRLPGGKGYVYFQTWIWLNQYRWEKGLVKIWMIMKCIWIVCCFIKYIYIYIYPCYSFNYLITWKEFLHSRIFELRIFLQLESLFYRTWIFIGVGILIWLIFFKIKKKAPHLTSTLIVITFRREKNLRCY